MTINGTDLSEYHARQHHVDFGYHAITNSATWVQAAVLPHFGVNYIDFKAISIEFSVYGSGRDDIHRHASDLLSALMDPCDLKLDGFSHMFRVMMQSHTAEEWAERRRHKITVKFVGYEYGEEQAASGMGNVTIKNPGNILSPLRVSITPSENADQIAVKGVCPNKQTGEDMPVLIEEVKSGVEIVLDGANGLFTAGGTLLKNAVIRCPPAMYGGTKRIGCTQAGAKLSVSVLPLFM